MKTISSFSRLALVLALGGLLAAGEARAADRGSEVVVVYNSRLPESRQVAEYYAERRQVPKEQVFGFDMQVSEAMTRQEFIEQLQQPLLKRLESGKLLTFSPATNRYPDFKPSDPSARQVLSARIRYAALCYGVPTRILKDPALVETLDTLVPQIRGNGAAVDTQLALLPSVERRLRWGGWIDNPFYNFTNALMLHPTNGLLMVTRLDGPSAAIARGLVDQAMEAETNGLWGRAYFDARGLGTNDSFRLGDDYIKGAAAVAQRFGFEVELDDQPATFSSGHPLSQIALYAGWYDQIVTGPFTLPTVEFMPGAFAYHLYSFSAHTIRSTNSWVGTLLQKGATCTMGAVDEPFLQTTPDIYAFVGRWAFLGFTFGEAAYCSQNCLSWQTTLIGDPLYQPFGKNLQSLHQTLEKQGSRMQEWSHLLVANRNLLMGSKPDEIIGYIQTFPVSRQSAVLTEKVGDLYATKRGLSDAIDSYETALKRNPSPQQKLRLLFKLAEKRVVYGPDAKAYEHYESILKEFPTYPEQLKVYQQMLPIAKRLNNTNEVQRCEKEIKRLSPAPPAKP